MTKRRKAFKRNKFISCKANTHGRPRDVPQFRKSLYSQKMGKHGVVDSVMNSCHQQCIRGVWVRYSD